MEEKENNTMAGKIKTGLSWLKQIDPQGRKIKRTYQRFCTIGGNSLILNEHKSIAVW